MEELIKNIFISKMELYNANLIVCQLLRYHMYIPHSVFCKKYEIALRERERCKRQLEYYQRML